MTAKNERKRVKDRESPIRFGLDLEDIAQDYKDNMLCLQGRMVETQATGNDILMALAYTVRDRLVRMRQIGFQMNQDREFKVVAYFSAEFLMGPQLGNNMISLGIYNLIDETLKKEGYKLDVLLDIEQEPGLGNGGLGRLAACFLDSLAALDVMAVGYGIRYEFGIFDQIIKDGWQVEITDKWLQLGNPWEIPRPEISQNVGLGGRTEHYYDEQGKYCVRWIPERQVKGVPFDTWIPGYHQKNCSLLRLWKAEATESFDFQSFNKGGYYEAVEDKIFSENISKVLYPNDERFEGKQLRLEQQHFFVSCSLQDMIGMLISEGMPIEDLCKFVAIQINDTHPSIGIAELMRLLVDVHWLDWDRAWDITCRTYSYTNHTLLPEALEKWPVKLFGSLLPRHLEIVYEINRRFLDIVRERFPGDEARIGRMSLIDESGERYVRMAYLACVGSHSINGVAELHSELVRNELLRDFYELWPDKFLNVTNGVTPRRWVVLSNPGLGKLINEAIGEDWITDMYKIRSIEKYAADEIFMEKWREIKRDNKVLLAGLIKERTGVTVNPDSMFDVQAKRIHEYKRQHLNVLHIITLYNRLKNNPGLDITPRTFIFGGKAAPGYFMAKLIIKLINSVADVVNNDKDTRDRLSVAFFPDFNVQNGQRIYPAADLSEQISTAGKEASGTGNMKFSMNGALTIGTLDGANIEIREEVGADNFFLFGLTAGEVETLNANGYHPADYYNAIPELRQAIDSIMSGRFSKGDGSLFKPLVDSLMSWDTFMLFADYQSYIDCQDAVGMEYADKKKWTEKSILNVARMGKFSSDRAIREYCEKIWGIRPGV
jgi:starch phosphorylase